MTRPTITYRLHLTNWVLSSPQAKLAMTWFLSAGKNIKTPKQASVSPERSQSLAELPALLKRRLCLMHWNATKARDLVCFIISMGRLAQYEAIIAHICCCKKQDAMVLLQPQSSNCVRWSSCGVTLPPGTLEKCHDPPGRAHRSSPIHSIGYRIVFWEIHNDEN